MLQDVAVLNAPPTPKFYAYPHLDFSVPSIKLLLVLDYADEDIQWVACLMMVLHAH